MSLAEEVAGQIARYFPVEMILLFGSRARGDERPDSDWDFLVVMPTDLRPLQRTLAVRRVVRQLPNVRGVPIDILVLTPEEMRRGFPLAKEIISEGEVLFHAPA